MSAQSEMGVGRVLEARWDGLPVVMLDGSILDLAFVRR
jgi:hypothetical protein